MSRGAVIGSSIWASSGAMHLTGDPDGAPLALEWGFDARLEDLAGRFGLGAGVLSERAAMLGLGRRGRISCGGGARMVRARDGWLACSLTRPEDFELLPALLGTDLDLADRQVAWRGLAQVAARRDALELESRAELLGIPLGVIGRGDGPMTATGVATGGSCPSSSPLVVDLASLWAGPFCADLLRRVGARVVKVEDPARPDGARNGSKEFYALLNQEKASVALDFRSAAGRARLLDLLAAADVVVTSARSRAFEQLDIGVAEVLATRSDKVWTAITAYGWSSNRVGFGDDVAAGAGLVAWHPVDGEPRFAGDAIADPLCGLEAAVRTLDCLAEGGRWFVDASLAGAARLTEPSRRRAAPAVRRHGGWFLDDHAVEYPRSRRASAAACPLGADTESVLAGLSR